MIYIIGKKQNVVHYESSLWASIEISWFVNIKGVKNEGWPHTDIKINTSIGQPSGQGQSDNAEACCLSLILESIASLIQRSAT